LITSGPCSAEGIVPRFAANLSMLYPELSLLDRAAAAARDGFAAVEVQGPYAVEATDFRAALHEARVQLVLMNAPVGDFSGGERGLAALPGHEFDFDRSIEQALDYARAVAAPRVHLMAGAPSDVNAPDRLATYERNIGRACDILGRHGIEVMIEPINRRDAPGYFLSSLSLALEVIDRLQRRPRLQFDFYHLQIIQGDLIRSFEHCYGRVGHVQIAGVPDRHEPDGGEVDYRAVFRLLDRLYSGWVGCEYRPAASGPSGTSAGLGWMRRL
jgi:hydroxypyruvate isomerase